METFFLYYTACWSVLCVAALVALVLNRRACALLSPEYRRFLTVPWKLITFAVAGGVITFAAPYSGDPTWDYVDGSVMSVLTYTTAPWVAGTLYRAYRGMEKPSQVFAALVVMMFSASWSYDLWIILRDGIYPPSWLPNIPISVCIYIAAGMLWSLEHGPRLGAFTFTKDRWPSVGEDANRWTPPGLAAMFMLFGLAWVIPFVWMAHNGR